MLDVMFWRWFDGFHLLKSSNRLAIRPKLKTVNWKMNLKGFLVGSVCAVALLGSQLSLAWDANSVQRGWVDFVGFDPYPGPVFGPTQTIGIRGWACVRPGLPDYGVPSTQVAVYRGGPPGVGVRVPVFEIRQVVYRYDVVAAGACANVNNGFVVWVAHTNYYLPKDDYYVVYEGPYVATLLEGQH
ncbi:hypothetical protein [Archangium sp.]|uniref:hypothetical protein n=1 Tax=Archangium sp. TaxID=1872627 RepID=UPI002D687E6B|nr:hypothetical protein [Archangium sp.]HYO56462.1 hypothetical protein [Archangium sp.]